MADLDGRAFISDGRSLWPADLPASEFLAGLPKNKAVLVTIRKPRSIDQHNFYFAVLRCVVRATDRWLNEKALLKTIKVALGHVDPWRDLDGKIHEDPASIAFESMPGDEFQVFFDRTMQLFEERVGIEPLALLEEADKISRRPKRLIGWQPNGVRAPRKVSEPDDKRAPQAESEP